MNIKDIVQAIKAGQFTPSELEDMVYAMEYAYQDHYPQINDMLPFCLEYMADDMVVARRNTED